jgi:hypothetical protein
MIKEIQVTLEFTLVDTIRPLPYALKALPCLHVVSPWHSRNYKAHGTKWHSHISDRQRLGACISKRYLDYVTRLTPIASLSIIYISAWYHYFCLSLQILIRFRRSLSDCCIGFNLLSQNIAWILSPCFSTSFCIHSSSCLLCCLGRRFLIASCS